MNTFIRFFTSALIMFEQTAGTPDGDDFFGKAAQVINTFYESMKIIVIPICALAIGFCGVQLMVNKDQQSLRTAKNALIATAIGLLLFLLAPQIAKTIQSMAQ